MGYIIPVITVNIKNNENPVLNCFMISASIHILDDLK